VTWDVPTLVHLVASKRLDGGPAKPEKTADLRFHMTVEDAQAQLDAMPEDVRSSFAVIDAHLTVLPLGTKQSG